LRRKEELMSRSINRISLLGHVGRDPEVRQTQSGTKVANISVATNHTVGAGGESPKERTEWHRVTIWGRLAAFAEEYVRKGDRVYLEGRLEYDAYERDGVTIPTAEVHVHELVLLSPRREGDVEYDEEAA
jgi:single-strand DNA-binding protein